MELVSPGEDQALPELGILLQKGTGKGKRAASAAIHTGVQSCSMGELSCLGLAMNPPSAWVSVFSENEDCGKSLPCELLMNARPGGASLYLICQQLGGCHRGGSQG